MKLDKPANRAVTIRKRLCFGDHVRIAQVLGLSMGEYWGIDDDCRNLAFTVCGGQLVWGGAAPEWLASMNGCRVQAIAEEAIRRGAVRPAGRWEWERVAPEKGLTLPNPRP